VVSQIHSSVGWLGCRIDAFGLKALGKILMFLMFGGLTQVGPRFCMNPIKIFSGSFGGQTLYENPFYVSPNTERSRDKRKKAGKYAKKVKAKQRRKSHLDINQTEPSELANVWDEE
jgi:hypothetical protein